MPRHAFVPRFYDENRNLVDGTEPEQQHRWLSAIYSDVSLVTQRTPLPDTDVDWSTSSSSMPQQGYFADPAHELAHLDFRIFRAARIVVGTALRCQDMDPAQAEEYIATRASLSPDTAKAKVDRYCAWPPRPDWLEIEQLRAEWPGDLRRFHDTLAGTGCLPLGLARRALTDAS